MGNANMQTVWFADSHFAKRVAISIRVYDIRRVIGGCAARPLLP